MSQIIFVPLEMIEERYSLDWYRWFRDSFCNLNINTITVMPTFEPQTIKRGQFLDSITTNRFKSQQLTQICNLFEQELIDDQTTFLFMDSWFPGLELLAYIRNALKINFKIVGMFHAGTWDRYDYISQNQMTPWAAPLELCWLEILDGVCVATEFHKDLIIDAQAENEQQLLTLEKKIHVTGFPIYQDFVKPVDKKPLIIFPHRLAPEKNPQRFYKMIESDLQVFPTLKYFSGFTTKDYINFSNLDEKGKKELYYQLLNQSTFAVSFADQETFGIAMLEAALCGCFPIVPDRLSYSELFPNEFKYTGTNSDAEMYSAMHRMIAILQNKEFYQFKLAELQNKILALGQAAIPNIINVCESFHE